MTTEPEDPWWSLPGPARFLDRAAALTNGPSGVLGLAVPRPAPIGWEEALVRRLDAATSLRPVVVDAAPGLRGRSPVRMLATAAGLETAGLYIVAAFVDHPAIADVVFLVHGVPAGDWRQWSLFLRGFRAERASVARLAAPAVAMAVPQGVSPDDLRATLGAPPLRWQGRLSRLDTALYVDRLSADRGDGLLARVAAETTIEFAGWDRAMAEALASLPPEQQLDPIPRLRSFAEQMRDVPCWENGLVDDWDGAPHVGTLVLVATGDEAALRHRLWSARVRSLFPFIHAVRLAFVRKYRANLSAALPITRDYNGRQVVYDDPERLELHELRLVLEPLLPRLEQALLRHCYRLRTAMAHADPGDARSIVEASSIWERIEDDFPSASAGWDWPRCGQSLVLLVGPSGAGKSTYAAAHYDAADIVSSDAIRQKILGSLEAEGDQAPVFLRVREEVRMRLAAGRRAVVDATNIKAADRLANALLAPPDVPVEYVVIDRPMAEKRGRADWRAARPGLLEAHARQFAADLPAILAGDGLPNATLVDLIAPSAGGDADADTDEPAPTACRKAP